MKILFSSLEDAYRIVDRNTYLLFKFVECFDENRTIEREKWNEDGKLQQQYQQKQQPHRRQHITHIASYIFSFVRSLCMMYIYIVWNDCALKTKEVAHTQHLHILRNNCWCFFFCSIQTIEMLWQYTFNSFRNTYKIHYAVCSYIENNMKKRNFVKF